MLTKVTHFLVVCMQLAILVTENNSSHQLICLAIQCYYMKYYMRFHTITYTCNDNTHSCQLCTVQLLAIARQYRIQNSVEFNYYISCGQFINIFYHMYVCVYSKKVLSHPYIVSSYTVKQYYQLPFCHEQVCSWKLAYCHIPQEYSCLSCGLSLAVHNPVTQVLYTCQQLLQLP